MRTLFLAAKKFALDEEASEINLEHFKKAINAVEFVDAASGKVVWEYLKCTLEPKASFTAKNIQEAAEYKTIPFDEDVKKFKEYLAANDLGLSVVATKLFIDKKNSLATFKESIHRLESSLSSQVFGQETAIEAICDKIVESHYNISTNGPRGIYLFLGPPATGKTMLSEIMGKELDGYDGFKIFDMTQYVDEESGFGLFGSEAVYKDSKEGKLTKYVKEHPKSVIVFDEIEKTHPSVLSNFLMMLSSGKAEDTHTEEVIDFTQTMLVFTSNLGTSLYNNQNFLDMMKENSTSATSIILDAIGREEKLVSGRMVKAISPEMLSRLSQGQVILFNKLPFNALLNIAKKKVLEMQSNFENEFGIKIEYKNFDTFITGLILSLAPLIDVRKLKAKLPLVIFDLITDYIRKNDNDLSTIYFGLDSTSAELIQKELLTLDATAQTKFLHKLFRKNETFTYSIQTFYKNTLLTFQFENLTQTKLARSNDFGGDDGLIFEVPSVSFENVAGHHVAKKRLKEVINIL